MLSLTHLKYFHDAAVLGGIAPAASRNRISPSAVSQAVRNLETHFDAELLVHSRNRFELTDEGRRLLERSHAIFAATEHLEEEMRAAKTGYAGTVTFATQQSIAHHLLPPFMARLQRDYPELRPNIKLAPTDVVKRWIETREVDFGLSVDNVAHEAFASLPIYEGEFVLVEAASRTASDAARTFILPGEGTRESVSFRRDYEARFGAPPPVSMEVKSWGVIKRFAELGMGVGLVPDYVLRCEAASGLRRVDLGLPRIPLRISAFYCRKRNALSRNCRQFLAELETFVREL